METIGYASLQIIPSFKDVGRKLTSGISGDMQTAGRKAGDAFSSNFERNARASVSADRLAPSTSDMGREGTQAGDAFGDGLRREMEQAADKASTDTAEALEGNKSKFRASGSAMATALGASLKGGLAAAGVAAGAALIAGTAGAMAKESVTDKLNAQLGAGGKNARRYGKVAGDLYAGAWGESLADVSDSVAKVVTNIGGMRTATQRELKAVTASVLDIATAFDQDTSAISRAVDQLVRTDLAKGPRQALNIITRGFQSGANEADDLLDTYAEYATQFRKLGLSGKQATGLLSQGLKAGARDADIVADAFKEFSIRAVDGSDLTRQGFKALGLDAEDMAKRIGKGGKSAAAGTDEVLDRLRKVKDPVDQSRIAVALFGTQAEDMGKALFKLDPSKAVKSLGDVGNAAKKMGDTLNDNASTRVEAFKRKLQTGLVDFMGDKVLPALQKFGDFLQTEVGPRLTRLGDWISKNVAPVWRRFWGWVTDELGPALKKFYSQYLDGISGGVKNIGDSIDKNKPFFKALGRVLADAGKVLVEHVIPAAGKFAKIYLPLVGKAIGHGITAIKLMVSWWLLLEEWGAKALKGLFRASTFAFGKILDAAAAALGWIPKFGPKIKDARDAFDKFREGGSDALDKIAGNAKHMREEINKPASVKIEDRKARRQLKELQRLGNLRIRMLAPSSGRSSPGLTTGTGMAGGGKIGGRGTGTSDSNLLYGSRGEWMIRARAAKHYGDAFMSALNNMQLPKMAGGGAIGGGGGGVNFNGPITVVAHDYGDFMRQMNHRARKVNSGGSKF